MSSGRRKVFRGIASLFGLAFLGLFALGLVFLFDWKKEPVKPLKPIYKDLFRGPYLQSATPGSVKLIFYTSREITSELLVISDSSEKRFSIKKPAGRHVYHLRGVEPGKKYAYKLVLNGEVYEEKNWHFSTFSDHDTATTRFWVTGDFGGGNNDQRAVRFAFQEYLATNPVNFWLWLGDNVYYDGTREQYFNKVFDKYWGYDSIMKFMPFFPTPGNHDYESISRMPWNYRKNQGPYFDLVDVLRSGEGGGVPSGNEMYYSFDAGNVHFISLNSDAWRFSVFWNKDMKNWLEKDLQQSKKKWTVVFFHQPPYTFGSHRSDAKWEVVMRGMRKKYVPLLEKYGVDLVLNGHSHVYERSYLIAGKYRKTGEPEPHHIVSKGQMMDGFHQFTKSDTGTLYVVVGNSGKDHTLAPEPHPVMAFGYGGLHKCGSLIVTVKGDTLSGEYLTKEGEFIDRFRVVKD